LNALKLNDMISIQKIGKLALVLLVLGGFASCKDEQETAPFEVTGEVILIKRMIDDEVMYARTYFAYGNQPMQSGEVTLAEGGTLPLTAADDTKRTWQKTPAIVDFSATVPVIGQFDFTVMNEDIEHMVSDVLEFNDLGFPTIDSAGYNNGTIRVEWQDVANADSYLVRMVDENYELVFVGQLLNTNYTTYEIASNSGVWSKTPANGETYMVEVHAFKFEDGATNENYLYNANDLSIASKEVVWGN